MEVAQNQCHPQLGLSRHGDRRDASGSVNVLTQTAGQIKRGNAPHVACQRDAYVCGGAACERFFQWVCHPEIEVENNLAERRLRPLVIARKVCFGSQSEKGLKTRETLMTIIDTLSLRCDDPVAKLSQVLDAIGRDRNADVSELLWGPKNAASEAAAA